ncbi:MAG: protease modulator HflC [Planctomycetota bacterium]|nr:protease modulator HflC [Planctomycetota bacterium]
MSNSETPNPDSASRPVPRAVLRVVAAIAGIGLAAWLSTCLVFVDETEVVLIERLGTVVAVLDHADDRGLNVKLPWPIGMARRFDRRTHLFDPLGREAFTRDRKNVTVDAYVCWKIADPQANTGLLDRPAVRFFRSLGTTETAQARLETRVRSALATRIAMVELGELLSVSDPESQPVESTEMSMDSISRQLLDDVRRRPDEESSVLDRLGVDIVDVRIKRINFPRGNQQAVFERMKSERQKIAGRYRSAGLAQNAVIRSQADRQYSEIISRAEAEAERIRGTAEAEALAVLNEAHARDPEFYRTLRTLDSYKTIINEKTTLVLSASSSLLKLLVEGVPDAATVQTPGSINSGEDPDRAAETAKADTGPGNASGETSPGSDTPASDDPPADQPSTPEAIE